MKKRIQQLSIFVLLSLICHLSGVSQDHETDFDICGLENNAFMHNESLTYKLYYNLSFVWIPAGEVNFQIQETDSTYEASIIGKSYGSYDNFFKVRDEFHSVVDKETMMPLSFYRKVEEGNDRSYNRLVFDYELDRIYSENGETKELAVADTFDLDNCTYDLVTIMYTLRNVDIDQYSIGDHIASNIFFDKEYNPIDIEYLKKETKKVRNLGKFRAIKIRPEIIIGNVFKEGDEMSVWISDDENKIPLLIESPIRIGSVKAVLKEYKGLRYELSKI